MSPIPLIKDVMTPFPHAIDAAETLEEAGRVMATHGIRHLPVKWGHNLWGMLSERDLHRAARRPPGERRTVGEVCSTEVYVVGLAEPLDRVLDTMVERRLGSVLIVKDGRLAGIFTATDACRRFADRLRAEGGGDDEAA